MADPTAIQITIDEKIEGMKESPKKKGRGGARPNSGVPVGYKQPKTLEQRKVKEVFNQLVMRGATKLFNAQFNLALGEQSLFVKYHVGEGKNQRTEVDVVTDVELIKEYLVDDGMSLNNDSDDEYYYISTKPANNLAIQSLLDRALGKAPDRLEISGGFFIQNNLTVEVIGKRNDLIDINPDGTIGGLDDGGAEGTATDKDTGERAAEPGDISPQPPTNS